MKHHHRLTQEEANLGLTTALAPCCHSCLYWQLPWPRRWWGALHRWLDKIFEGMGGGGGVKRESETVSVGQEYQSWKWKDIYKSCVTHVDYKKYTFYNHIFRKIKKAVKEGDRWKMLTCAVNGLVTTADGHTHLIWQLYSFSFKHHVASLKQPPENLYLLLGKLFCFGTNVLTTTVWSHWWMQLYECLKINEWTKINDV